MTEAVCWLVPDSTADFQQSMSLMTGATQTKLPKSWKWVTFLPKWVTFWQGFGDSSDKRSPNYCQIRDGYDPIIIALEYYGSFHHFRSG